MASTNGSTRSAANGSSHASHPATDPAVYEQYRFKWVKLPSTVNEWFERAAEVKDVLALDVVKRDRENKTPRAEVALLKHSGLLKIMGAVKYGGGGQPWDVGYKVIREIAKSDG